MPRLAMDALAGRSLPEYAGFREVAMVRFLDEVVVPVDEIKAMAA